MSGSATLRALGALVLLSLVGGALPGEMYSCTTDLSDEIDPTLYCRERCRVLCEGLTTCGLYEPMEEPDEGETDQDLCRASCERQYQCVSPFLCVNADAYVSLNEADECLDGWARVSCQALAEVPLCAVDLGACPRPQSCKSEELCDPPVWE